jgi:D-3-phosphoglycerate dehydrogenase
LQHPAIHEPLKDIHFLIDFDSTFIKVESLEVLAEISLRRDADKQRKLDRIKALTDLAMNGEMPFAEALAERLSLLGAHESDVTKAVSVLKRKVTDSFVRNKTFFQKQSGHIYILSSGFAEMIEPVVAAFGIRPEHVFANRFVLDAAGAVTGADTSNPLSGNGGKVQVVKSLKLKGDVYVIGDGYTDYELKKAGLADYFYAFTENVRRTYVVKHADHVLPNLDELLFKFKMPASVSYPKNRMKVLLLENIHPEAAAMFKQEGYEVETHTGAMEEEILLKHIHDVSILGIRSKTMVTAPILEQAKKLLTVGAFCIGTNQIDLPTCTAKGISVFNAPYSNTRSVVELALAEIILLMRRIPDKSKDMHQGRWDKSAANSREIRGKKLGIVGYGNIGSQLSVLAEAMGMEVYFYDVVDKLALGNARRCGSLKELLRMADVVSLHVDGRPENTALIGKAEFNAMRKGVVLINLSRGHVCDVPMLAHAIQTGKVAGLGMDVFPEEPTNNKEPFISELRGLPNVLLTPHIGGSTEEAQENIARFVPSKIIEYINSGSTYTSVNFPNLQLPQQKNAHRLIHVHENKPGILAQINSIMAQHKVNILGQYLKTNDAVGYVITDINKAYNKEVTAQLRAIAGTLRFRVLY